MTGTCTLNCAHANARALGQALVHRGEGGVVAEVGVPDLGGDVELVAGNPGRGDARAGAGLVPVVGGGVDRAVPGFEGGRDRSGRFVVGDAEDAETEILRERIAHRAETNLHRRAHNDAGHLATITTGDDAAPTFVPVSMEVPELRVDTTDGYHPGLETIARFITQRD